MGLGGLGLPCGACGCTPGCSDCGWTSNGYPVAGSNRTNYCCEPQCYPCELTLQVAAGTTWTGFSIRYLTTADRNAIASYLSGTWVLRHEPLGVDRYPNYQFQSSSWLASAIVSVDISAPCDAYWPSYSTGAYLINGGNYIQNSVSPVYTGSSLLSLSGGKYMTYANMPFVSQSQSGDIAPFSMSDWCNVSSWSTTIVTPTTVFTPSIQNQVVFYDPARSAFNTVYFTGHTFTLSW